MAQRHWKASDFLQTSSRRYDGEPVNGRPDAVQGYCRKCGGDMQAFASDNWKLRHYNSHQETRSGAVGYAPTAPVRE